MRALMTQRLGYKSPGEACRFAARRGACRGGIDWRGRASTIEMRGEKLGRGQGSWRRFMCSSCQAPAAAGGRAPEKRLVVHAQNWRAEPGAIPWEGWQSHLAGKRGGKSAPRWRRVGCWIRGG